MVEKHCVIFFSISFLQIFFFILLQIICDFDNIWMKNTCSMAIYSLKIKRVENDPKFEKMPISQSLVALGQNPLGCEGQLGSGSQSCPFVQDP